MNKIFEGKKALVIGGTGGIGLEIAKRLLFRGAEICVHGAHKKNPAQIFGLPAESELEKKIELIEYDFKNHHFEDLKDSVLLKKAESCDILCVCYGPFVQKSLDEMTLSDWQTVSLLDYALPGVFVSAALKNMRQKNWGRILLFGGTGTDHRTEYRTNAAYAGAKCGVGILVQSTAAFYADSGITCNALLPGFTKTEYTAATDALLAKKMPLGTLVSSASVAESGMFLLENPDLNGVLLRVDRGWSPNAR